MRNLTSLLLIGLALTVGTTTALAQHEEDWKNRTIKIGDPLNFCSEIVPDTQWYLIATNYTKQDPAYLWEKETGVLYLSVNGLNDVVDGMDPSAVPNYLIHFEPATVTDPVYDVYYMQFATDNYIRIMSDDHDNYPYVYLNAKISHAAPMYVYNTGGTAGHFGFYEADEYEYALWAGRGPGSWLWAWGNGTYSTVGTACDFSIYPVDMVLPEMTEHELALYECQEAYAKYIVYSGTFTNLGSEPNCYDPDAVAAFEAALVAASGCDVEDTESLSTEDLQKWTQDLIDAYTAVMDSYVAQVNVDDGYYFIRMAGVDFNFDDAALYTTTASDLTCSLSWSELQHNAYYLWQLTGKGDNAYEVKNVGTGTKFTDPGYNQRVMLTSDSETLMIFDWIETTSAGDYIIKIRSTAGLYGGNTYLWGASTKSGEGTGGGVYGYYGTYNPSKWQLVAVSDEEVQSIMEAFDNDLQERYASARAMIIDATDKMELAYDDGSETSQAVAMGSIFTNLQAAIERAEEEGSELSEATYQTLTEAYNAFIAVYVDPTGLRDKLDEASTLANGIVAGTNPGTWSDTSVSKEMEETIATATAYDATGKYTAEETAQYIETLKSQMAAVTECANKVQTGRWYNIRVATEQEVTDYGWEDINVGAAEDPYLEIYGKYISVADLVQNEDDGLYYPDPVTDLQDDFTSRELRLEAKDEIRVEDIAKFRFISVGDSAYIIQNKATSLFIRTMGTDANHVVLSVQPSLFTVEALGYGENDLEAKTLAGEEHNYLYAWQYKNCLITWPFSGVGSPNGFFIEDIDEEVASDYEESAEYYMNVSAGALIPMCYPFSVRAKDGTIYGAEIDGTTLTLSPLTDNKAQAGQPFVFIDGDLQDYDAEDDTQELMTFTHGYDLEAEPQTSGALVGTYYITLVEEGTAIAEGNAFSITTHVLSSVDANSAYIPGFETSDEITIVVEEGEYNDIDTPSVSSANQEENIYSIDGKLIGKGNLKTVRSLARGIYIVNGVKVVVK